MKRVSVLFHDFFLIYVLRIRQLVVFDLSSFLPTHEYFVFEYLGKLFLSLIILLAGQLVLFEIQYIRDGRAVIPIFERRLVAAAH